MKNRQEIINLVIDEIVGQKIKFNKAEHFTPTVVEENNAMFDLCLNGVKNLQTEQWFEQILNFGVCDCIANSLLFDKENLEKNKNYEENIEIHFSNLLDYVGDIIQININEIQLSFFDKLFKCSCDEIITELKNYNKELNLILSFSDISSAKITKTIIDDLERTIKISMNSDILI